MKITFVLPTVSMGGGIKVVGIYAKALAERGHKVVLVSPPSKEIPFRWQPKSLIAGRGWIRYKQSGSHLDGLATDHRILDCWRPAVDADVPDADVVIATWWETAEWGASLDDRKGAKVYFVQGHEVLDHLPVERCRATYHLPLYKIVISKWLQNIMKAEYGCADVGLVLNSVDHPHFFSDIRGKQQVPTLGFLCSHAKFKGEDLTMQVVKNLRNTFPNLRVIAFGSVQPESNSDFDDRAMEAMACRVPVVSTRTGWPEEAVVSGKNGFLVDVDDVLALTQGGATILALSDKAWREMSLNAFDAVALSSREDSASQFEKALESAFRRSKANTPRLN